MAPQRSIILALCLGPLGLFDAGRTRAAAVAAIALGLALLVYAWFPYLAIYMELDGGGGTAKEVTQTSIMAAEAWIRSAPQWAPGGWWVPALGNLACTAWLALRRGPEA